MSLTARDRPSAHVEAAFGTRVQRTSLGGIRGAG